MFTVDIYKNETDPILLKLAIQRSLLIFLPLSRRLIFYRFFTLSLLTLFGLSLFSFCKRQPEFSNIPKISIDQVSFLKKYSSVQDAIVLNLTFEDGNGDIGFDEGEAPTSYNFYADIYRKKTNGSFELYPGKGLEDTSTVGVVAPFTFQLRIPKINPLKEAQPLSGKIKANLPSTIYLKPVSTLPDQVSGLLDQIIKVRCYLVDRSGNKSNVLDSPEVIIRLK